MMYNKDRFFKFYASKAVSFYYSYFCFLVPKTSINKLISQIHL